MLSLFFSVVTLLATTVLASAVVVHEALAPHAACPVTSRYKSYYYSTTWLSTTTLTNGVSYLGHVTSTKTESVLHVYTTRETVISPSVTTLPSELSTLPYHLLARSIRTPNLLTPVPSPQLPPRLPRSLCSAP